MSLRRLWGSVVGRIGRWVMRERLEWWSRRFLWVAFNIYWRRGWRRKGYPGDLVAFRRRQKFESCRVVWHELESGVARIFAMHHQVGE